MGSIRININSKAMPKQTSTTFTETFARFFLHAWYLKTNHKQSSAAVWLVRDPSAKDYETRKSVAKNFQGAINDMISQYDTAHGFNESSLGRWTRDKIECHLLLTISGVKLNKTQ